MIIENFVLYLAIELNKLFMANVLDKIKKAGLVGRGGACFSTAKKWSAVRNAVGDKKYAVCNAAEGEPGVSKDGYILENFGDKVIDGLKLAIDFLKAEKAFIYLNYAYNKKLGKKIKKLINGAPIEIFVKPISAGYIGGEESAVLNAIEGRRIEPRLKPPFPTAAGLWNSPTLINNVETFYNVSLVNAGEFKNKRFYTITGDCPNEGVYELADDLTIEKILKQTKNYPKFKFFVQVGGNASGEVFNAKQLKRPASGAGSIAVYSLVKNNFKKAVKNWLDFYLNESCGQCTACREGVYRLREALLMEKIDRLMVNDLLENLSDSSFCALGSAITTPIRSLMQNVYQKNN